MEEQPVDDAMPSESPHCKKAPLITNSVQSSVETTQLTPHPPDQWTDKDKWLVALNMFMKLGDSIEIYLPGVITQVVSCELGVTKFQEGWFGIALYVSMSLSTLCAAPISNRLGRRPVLLFSLYISILATILCSVSPMNYPLLLASRLSIGFCVGLNISTCSVYVAENVSSHRVYTTGTFIDSFFFAAGGGWVAVLGYFVLGKMGWRVFVLFTSLPLFLPPIVMLHCYLKEERGVRYIKLDDLTNDDLQARKDGLETVSNIKTRIFQASIANFVNILQGFGCILLLPVLLRLNHERGGKTSENCASSVQGNDFLIVGLLTGGAHLLGRSLGFLVTDRFRFWTIQSVLAVIMLACYGALILDYGYMTTIVALGIANIVYSMTRLELKIMECDINFFGKKDIATASAITLGVGLSGAVVGTSFAEFLEPSQAVMGTFICSWMLLLSVFSVRQYKN